MAGSRGGTLPRSEALPRRPAPAPEPRRRRRLRAVSGGGPTPGERRPGDHRAAPAPGDALAPRYLAGVHVLVVEDDEDSADYFAVALRTSGAVVATAANAPEALRMIAAQQPDVVLSDIAMPGHDGYWLIRAIREHPDAKVRELPIVATTAHGHDHSRKRTLAAGFVDHVPKPVDPETLCAAIARAARR
ncbi:MAG: response regulator [Candidatus Rokubacteria bacterium]|nr:response regulator [Candidatus Rokubacteria bacterium]